MPKQRKLTGQQEAIRDLRKAFQQGEFCSVLESGIKHFSVTDLSMNPQLEKAIEQFNQIEETLQDIRLDPKLPKEFKDRLWKGGLKDLEQCYFMSLNHASEAMFDLLVRFFLRYGSLPLGQFLTVGRSGEGGAQ